MTDPTISTELQAETGDRFRAFAHAHGISLRDVAMFASIDETALQHKLNGTASMTIAELADIANACGVRLTFTIRRRR